MSGKVVQIEAVSDETLQLAEVEVYGRIAPGKIFSSSSRIYSSLDNAQRK